MTKSNLQAILSRGRARYTPDIKKMALDQLFLRQAQDLRSIMNLPIFSKTNFAYI